MHVNIITYISVIVKVYFALPIPWLWKKNTQIYRNSSLRCTTAKPCMDEVSLTERTKLHLHIGPLPLHLALRDAHKLQQISYAEIGPPCRESDEWLQWYKVGKRFGNKDKAPARVLEVDSLTMQASNVSLCFEALS
jgi:hypothetical protein